MLSSCGTNDELLFIMTRLRPQCGARRTPFKPSSNLSGNQSGAFVTGPREMHRAKQEGQIGSRELKQPALEQCQSPAAAGHQGISGSPRVAMLRLLPPQQKRPSRRFAPCRLYSRAGCIAADLSHQMCMLTSITPAVRSGAGAGEGSVCAYIKRH